MTFKGNLDASASADPTALTTYDHDHDRVRLPGPANVVTTIRFTKGCRRWTVEYQHDYSDYVDPADPSQGKEWTSTGLTLTFNTDGTLDFDPTAPRRTPPSWRSTILPTPRSL